MTKCEKLDAVIPLLLKDFQRFEILDKSLKKFCTDLINICWVVVRDDEYIELVKKIKNSFYEVIPESSIIPELTFYRHVRRIPSGWFIQQLIKLAISQKIVR